MYVVEVRREKMKRNLMILIIITLPIFLFTQTPNWQWVSQAGGDGWDSNPSIAIDDFGNSYVVGNFAETATFGNHTVTSSEGSDIFIAKMSTNGNWQWVQSVSGSNWEASKAITIDDNGNTYVTGVFEETMIFGEVSITSNGNEDIFVAKLDTNCNWQWVSQAGGSSLDQVSTMAIDANGNNYLAGYFVETTTFGNYTFTSNGSSDGFVVKVDEYGNWL